MIANVRRPLLDENYIDIELVCNFLGLDWHREKRQIESGFLIDYLSEISIPLPHPSGRMEIKTFWGIPERYYYGWLINVDPNEVKPSLRETLITYQRLAMELLAEKIDLSRFFEVKTIG